ncbi:MAG: class I SAM-dependent methyltransferase [Acidimicrobiales bacterium]|nr:class I SAM-dependent methyltransferase [Acidimicrobiales bacterium]
MDGPVHRGRPGLASVGPVNQPETSALDAFLAVFESLPRQGPGSRACTAQALAMCEGLPPEPDIVDLGCGGGAQTLDLAELTGGVVVAVDNHAPFAELLTRRAAARGCSDRVRPHIADMTDPGLPAERADLVWSEGALYNIGLAAALPRCHRLLRPGGYLAFTDAVWRTQDIPDAVRELFADYPTMGTVADVLALLPAHGFELIGHFPVPDDAWWDEFYTPMRARITELRANGSFGAEGLAALDRCDAEIDLFSEHGHRYGYEFFVARRPS